MWMNHKPPVLLGSAAFPASASIQTLWRSLSEAAGPAGIVQGTDRPPTAIQKRKAHPNSGTCPKVPKPAEKLQAALWEAAHMGC